MASIHGWTHQVLCLMESHGLMLLTLARDDNKDKDRIAYHSYINDFLVVIVLCVFCPPHSSYIYFVAILATWL